MSMQNIKHILTQRYMVQSYTFGGISKVNEYRKKRCKPSLPF